jgi:tetratricopeptide (TPR) repeat protein
MVRLFFTFLFLISVNLLFGQYRLYEEGIKKYNEKDYYSAIELFSDFITKPLHDKKFDADTYYWRGLAAFKLNDFVSAAEDLKLSLSLNHPNSGNIYWFLAKSLEKLNQNSESIAAYGSALAKLESDKAKKTQLLTERAQVHIKMENVTAAQQDLQAAASLDPTNKKIQQDLNNIALAKSRSTTVGANDIIKTNEQNKPVKPETKTVPVVQKEEVKSAPSEEQKAETKKETPVKSDPVAQNTEENKKEVQQVTQNTEEKRKETPANSTPGVKPEPSGAIPIGVAATKTAVEVPAEPTLADLYKDEKRFALIIGNSAYPKEIGVLKNPVNDATDFAEAIKKMGFDVTLITDASYGKIRAEMMKFRDKLNTGERDKTVGLFFYAGHGLQHDNENYIVPVDAELQFEDDIARYCFPIQKMVLTQMENTNSRMNIVILDACRNNPFPAIHRGIGESQGLGELKKARGAFIAYATAPGSVASDGTGRNGLYTQELIKAMNKPNRTIEQVFKDVRASVLRQSGEKQNPWENSNIIGDFYFKLD